MELLNPSAIPCRVCIDCGIVVPVPGISRLQSTPEAAQFAAEEWDYPRCRHCRNILRFKRNYQLPCPYKIPQWRMRL